MSESGISFSPCGVFRNLDPGQMGVLKISKESFDLLWLMQSSVV
jgi:hypothetical protein